MPKPIATKFTEYDFSPEEMYAATRISDLTLMLIQTLAARAAADRLSLRIDVTKPDEFIQQEAALKGTIEAYEHLIGLAAATPNPKAPKAPETEVSF